MKPLLLASFFCGLGFSAPPLLTSVVLIGGEAEHSCSETRTDGTTAACHIETASGRGTALSSSYLSGVNAYVWFGSIHRTQDATRAVRTVARAVFADDYQDIQTTGQGVALAYGSGMLDVEPIRVYVNDGYGNYELVDTLRFDHVLVTLPYQGWPIDFYLEAMREAAG